MSADTLRIGIAVGLLLHGLAHLVALGALLAILAGAQQRSSLIPRLWVLPRSSARLAALVGALLWAAAAVGFLGAAAAIGGMWLNASAWRVLATAAAFISLVGIAAFAGTWPGSPTSRRSVLNTGIAVLVDLAIVAALLGLHWPPLELVGR
jgi:hypothetical protein